MLRFPVPHVALATMFAAFGGLSSVGTAVLPAAGNAPRVDRRPPVRGTIVADSTLPDTALLVSVPRLSVRPRAMATGTRTVQAGVQLLDSLRQTLVYVPPQCVGTHRCPLVVVLGGAAIRSREMVNPGRVLAYRSPFADQYGMILLAPDAIAAPGIWDVLDGLSDGTTEGSRTPLGMRVTQFRDADVRNIDAALKQVLRQFAIDPDKIAVEGFSNGGSYALFLGRNNPQVFSRIAAVSPTFPMEVDDPPHTTTQLFISGGIAEGPSIMQMWLRIATLLRHEGHQVEMVPGLRGHVDYRLDKDYEWGWLAQSWASPKSHDTGRVAPGAAADPILTVELLTKMTTFWTRFMQEPDSVLNTGRHSRWPSASSGCRSWP